MNTLVREAGRRREKRGERPWDNRRGEVGERLRYIFLGEDPDVFFFFFFFPFLEEGMDPFF
jgi:hypothetical protein